MKEQCARTKSGVFNVAIVLKLFAPRLMVDEQRRTGVLVRRGRETNRNIDV
jgi:hypothetical protein